MSRTDKLPFNWIQCYIPAALSILTNSLAVYLNLGVSGGDIFAGLLMISFQLLLTIGVGIYTFNWSFRKKRELLLGLLLAFGITGLFLHFIL